MKKIIHIITGLGSGGAENMLYKLVKYSDKSLFHHEIISLMDEGVMGEKIKAEGIRVHTLNLSIKNIPQSILKIKKISGNFDIVSTWLYHADLLGLIVAKLLAKKKLIWNIRHSNLDKDVNKFWTLKIVKVNSKLSRLVDCITFNSKQALENHLKYGYYDNNKSIIIPNGFELSVFKYNSDDRVYIRKQLSLSESEKVLITVGRWNVQKDYQTLMKALNELKVNNVQFKLIMLGTNLENSNEDLVALIKKYNLTKDILLLGRKVEIPAFLSAADIYVSSSLGESFSNAIGEAMASELHCVVTDVGESKKMVGDTGQVVKPEDYIDLANKLSTCLTYPIKDRNSDSRARVIERYEIKSIVKRIEENFSRI